MGVCPAVCVGLCVCRYISVHAYYFVVHQQLEKLGVSANKALDTHSLHRG